MEAISFARHTAYVYLEKRHTQAGISKLGISIVVILRFLVFAKAFRKCSMRIIRVVNCFSISFSCRVSKRKSFICLVFIDCLKAIVILREWFPSNDHTHDLISILLKLLSELKTRWRAEVDNDIIIVTVLLKKYLRVYV